MTARATRKLLSAFLAQAESLDNTRVRIDDLLYKNHMSRDAAEQMYESLFLGCFTAFEMLIENVFLSFLVAPAKGLRSSKAKPRIAVKSTLVAREVVFGPGKKYVDWLPFERTTERAEVFFCGGRPFSNVDKQNKTTIQKAQYIRNAIAHSSTHSMSQFRTLVIGNTAVPQREMFPGGYLRGQFSLNPPTVRYENIVTSLKSAAKQLC